MAIYDVSDLTKIYPGHEPPANDRLTFSIDAGEIFGLLGANGAGKTTLVKQLANLLAPTSGTLTFMGQPIKQDPLRIASSIGYMPQTGYALNTVTTAENLYFTAHLRGLSRQDARHERDRLINQLNLGAIRNKVATKVSGGQRRLLLLATALAASPPVLILDEPTNDLDPQHRRLVWETVRQANQERGMTIILVTHNVLEAEKVIERVGIMQGGRMIAIGRPGQLKASLNNQLRLEIIFQPEQLPSLPASTQPRIIAPGRWQLLINRNEAAHYLNALNGSSTIEDFQLSTATLEDLYIALTDAPANVERV